MKNFTKTAIYFFIFSVVLYSCSKPNMKGDAPGQADITPHKYGLLPASDADVSGIPLFTPAIFNEGKTPDGLIYSGSLPSSYLLTTPAIRDQGQIGSCTGFCGTEANEIVKYYIAGGLVPAQTPITSASGAMAAVNANKFTSPTNYFGAGGSLAPLFLYYVERVKIEGYNIRQDPGANMVNIGEALQGLTNNSGTGRAISPKGESTEDLYAYPITLNSQGYNVATSSSTQFRTAPGSSAIS